MQIALTIALNLLKCETWPNRKPEVDLRHHSRHFVKSNGRHNLLTSSRLSNLHKVQ